MMPCPFHRRRRPPRTHWRGRPMSALCDSRLHHLSSPRRRCSESLRASFHVEMGRRFIFGSSPEEARRREEDRADFQREAPA